MTMLNEESIIYKYIYIYILSSLGYITSQSGIAKNPKYVTVVFGFYCGFWFFTEVFVVLCGFSLTN